MVLARRSFLNKDYYLNLKHKLLEYTQKKGENAVILDCGCGEGYYTSFISQNSKVIAIDISKNAISLAAKRDKNALYVVGSSYDLPVKDNSVDMILSLFAPLAEKEFSRVLKKNGCVLAVVPAEKHLIELKELVYDSAYENNPLKYFLDGFFEKKREKLSYTTKILGNDSIKELFSMTPYSFKTSREGLEKLNDVSEINITIEFYLITFEKDQK